MPNQYDAKKYDHNGYSFTLRDWADMKHIPLQTLRNRVAKHWDIDKVLTTPYTPRSAEPKPKQRISLGFMLQRSAKMNIVLAKHNLAVVPDGRMFILTDGGMHVTCHYDRISLYQKAVDRAIWKSDKDCNIDNICNDRRLDWLEPQFKEIK